MIFDPDIHLRRIVLVGLGGTGSQLARSICRILYDMQQRGLATTELVFVDPDIVEEKNVGRQMFTVADVGRPKVEVLGERFSRALGLEIMWVADVFDASRHLIPGYYQNTALVIGAVDNHEARRALAMANEVWLDCGNHHSAGQVVLGNRNDLDAVIDEVSRASKRKGSERYTRHLPTVTSLFPAMLEPIESPQTDVSCADLVRFGDQHLLINDMIADVAANYVFKLLHRQPITSFITYVDLNGLNVRSLPITAEALAAYRQPEGEALAG